MVEWMKADISGLLFHIEENILYSFTMVETTVYKESLGFVRG